MKATYLHAAAALALTFAMAACSGEAPPPAPTPAPTPGPRIAAAPPPPPPLVTGPVFENYLDAPQTPGTWTYRDAPQLSFATFGAQDQAAVFGIECAKSSRQIRLVRAGQAAAPRAMTITAETGARTLTVTPSPDGRPLQLALVGATDPLLDAIAITKGRFAVAVEGERTLYLPAWAEVTRVIEDCR